MKKIVLALGMALSLYSAEAQLNRIEIEAGGYRFSNVIDQLDGLLNRASIRYQRTLHRNWAGYIQYSRMPLEGWMTTVEHNTLAKESVGKLTTRNKYNYFDLGAQYGILRYGRHGLSADGAISLAYGENSYLESVIWTEPEPGEPYGHPIDAKYAEKNEAYFGGLLGLRYDCFFWQQRLNAGINVAGRFYTGGFPFQVNYGLQLGFNF